MEGDTSKLGICLFDNLDWVSAAIIPVVVVRDDLGASKTVLVHQRSQCLSNICFLSRVELTGGVCSVAEPRLVLNPNCIGGDSLVSEPLQRFQEVRRIWRMVQLETKAPEVICD